MLASLGLQQLPEGKVDTNVDVRESTYADLLNHKGQSGSGTSCTKAWGQLLPVTLDIGAAPGVDLEQEPVVQLRGNIKIFTMEHTHVCMAHP